MLASAGQKKLQNPKNIEGKKECKKTRTQTTMHDKVKPECARGDHGVDVLTPVQGEQKLLWSSVNKTWII
jgi:hypothetical protein